MRWKGVRQTSRRHQTGKEVSRSKLQDRVESQPRGNVRVVLQHITHACLQEQHQQSIDLSLILSRVAADFVACSSRALNSQQSKFACTSQATALVGLCLQPITRSSAYIKSTLRLYVQGTPLWPKQALHSTPTFPTFATQCITWVAPPTPPQPSFRTQGLNWPFSALLRSALAHQRHTKRRGNRGLAMLSCLFRAGAGRWAGEARTSPGLGEAGAARWAAPPGWGEAPDRREGEGGGAGVKGIRSLCIRRVLQAIAKEQRDGQRVGPACSQ